MSYDHESFRLSEFKALREEILWLLKDYRALERNTVIAVGLSWVWLFSHPDAKTAPPTFAWFMPVLFVALGALRASAILKQFRVFHEYIREVEGRFLDSSDHPPGWEHYSWEKTGWVAESAVVLWVMLALSTLGVAIYEWPQSFC